MPKLNPGTRPRRASISANKASAWHLLAAREGHSIQWTRVVGKYDGIGYLGNNAAPPWMNCVFTTPNNRSQVEPNLAFAGGPPTPSDRRFCSESEMKRALEQSLAKERPVSPYHIALSFGIYRRSNPTAKIS